MTAKAKAASSKQTYEELKTELDSIMADLQRDDLDVDAALKQYERGLQLLGELEAKLKTAENKIHELRATFGASS